MRETTVAVHDDTKPRRKFDPQDIGTPAMCMLSLMATVLPDNLPLLEPTISVIHALHIITSIHAMRLNVLSTARQTNVSSINLSIKTHLYSAIVRQNS